MGSNNKQVQPKHAPKKEARAIIVSQMLEQTRNEVIRSDIELNFLKRLQVKISEGNISISQYTSDVLKQNIELTADQYNLSLERLYYLKEIKEGIKAEEVMSAVKHSTPSSVAVEY